jgi:hypothetical protein
MSVRQSAMVSACLTTGNSVDGPPDGPGNGTDGHAEARATGRTLAEQWVDCGTPSGCPTTG